MYLPGYTSQTVTTPNYRKKDRPHTPAGPVVVDSALTDSGSTPTWRIRPGNVLVLKTSTGRYVAANDAAGDRNTQATVTAAVTADAGWASKTYTFTVNGVAIVTVSSGAGDDTDAEIAAVFNADAIFKANLVASVAASRVVIKTLRAGKEQILKVTSNYATAFGASGTEAKGTDADYRILDEFVDLQDNTGTAVNASGPSVIGGWFNATNLVNLTNEAQAVLEKLGSVFI